MNDAGATNHMHYNEQILAAYIQASKKFHSISVNAGILVLKNCEAGHIKKPSDKNHKKNLSSFEVFSKSQTGFSFSGFYAQPSARSVHLAVTLQQITITPSIV